jgi:hypothetical protein
MIVLLFQSARKYIENQDATEIQLPRVYVDRHPEGSRGMGLIGGTAAKKVSFDRKQPGYKPPDSFVEREKSSESSLLAPGFISGVAFFNRPLAKMHQTPPQPSPKSRFGSLIFQASPQSLGEPRGVSF